MAIELIFYPQSCTVWTHFLVKINGNIGWLFPSFPSVPSLPQKSLRKKSFQDLTNQEERDPSWLRLIQYSSSLGNYFSLPLRSTKTHRLNVELDVPVSGPLTHFCVISTDLGIKLEWALSSSAPSKHEVSLSMISIPFIPENTSFTYLRNELLPGSRSHPHFSSFPFSSDFFL